MLKANNLTISVPMEGPCKKDCPYCVSKMTGYLDTNIQLMIDNAKKVITVAKAADVTSVLFTGKGEPLQNMPAIQSLSRLFEDWPLEIQTNASLLMGNDAEAIIKELYNWKFNTLSVSVDSKNMFKRLPKIIELTKKYDMIFRMSVNISDKLGRFANFLELKRFSKEEKVQQLSIRKLSIPQSPIHGTKDVKEWIKTHAPDQLYESIKSQMQTYIDQYGKKIRVLNHGDVVYDVEGISMVAIDYCIQEESKGDDIRSLIFTEDGHLYTSWASPASILF